jgi:pyruvate dehydrogenase E2 component (dihydrolipoamide acetyltransferase)
MSKTADLIVPNIGDFKNVEIIEILAKSEQNIKKNDGLITLESDKSSVEVPSQFSGKIKNIKVKVGDRVSQGDIIGQIELSSNEKIEEKNIKNNNKSNENLTTHVLSQNVEMQTVSVAPIKNENNYTKSASPKIKKFARELGVDLQLVDGTARKGRIVEEDVKQFIKGALNTRILKEDVIKKIETKEEKLPFEHEEFGEIDIQKIPRIKRLSGPHLVKAWNEIPHVTQFDEVDVTDMEHFRKNLIDLNTKEKITITPLAFIMKALVNAMRKYPNFNCSLESRNENVIYKKYFHIGIAVDTPHGLMVPKIRNVDQKDLLTLSNELRKIGKLSKELKIDKKEFFGGSMTISSLGGIGGSFFTPIINNPEVAIIGIGKTETKQMFIDGQFIPRAMIPISLSYDHRIIDGAEAARFCQDLKASLGKNFAFNLSF